MTPGRLHYVRGRGPAGDRHHFDRVVIRASFLWNMPCYEAQNRLIALADSGLLRPGHMEVIR